MSGKLEERGTRKLSLVLGAKKFEEIFLFFFEMQWEQAMRELEK